jgi:hypothetical protein
MLIPELDVGVLRYSEGVEGNRARKQLSLFCNGNSEIPRVGNEEFRGNIKRK